MQNKTNSPINKHISSEYVAILLDQNFKEDLDRLANKMKRWIKTKPKERTLGLLESKIDNYKIHVRNIPYVIIEKIN